VKGMRFFITRVLFVFTIVMIVHFVNYNIEKEIYFVYNYVIAHG